MDHTVTIIATYLNGGEMEHDDLLIGAGIFQYCSVWGLPLVTHLFRNFKVSCLVLLNE